MQKRLVLGPIRHQVPYLRVLEVEDHPLLTALPRLPCGAVAAVHLEVEAVEVVFRPLEAVELGRLP